MYRSSGASLCCADGVPRAHRVCMFCSALRCSLNLTTCDGKHGRHADRCQFIVRLHWFRAVPLLSLLFRTGGPRTTVRFRFFQRESELCGLVVEYARRHYMYVSCREYLQLFVVRCARLTTICFGVVSRWILPPNSRSPGPSLCVVSHGPASTFFLMISL